MADKKRPAVRVGKAAYGWGVFAIKKLKANRTVGRVRGDVIPDADYGSDYCIDLGNGTSIEPKRPFRCLNHSCEPNCELSFTEIKGKRKLWVETLRAIEPGEELTIDYGWPAEVAIPCGCRSPSCRGWIVEPSELPKLIRPPVHA